MRRVVYACVMLIGVSSLWLHLVHMVAGHLWFSVYGPALGLAFAGTISFLVVPPRQGWPAFWRRLGAAASLVVLLVVPEWLEGEIVANHDLGATTLGDHGWSTLVALATALALAIALEARRILRFLDR